MYLKFIPQKNIYAPDFSKGLAYLQDAQGQYFPANFLSIRDLDIDRLPDDEARYSYNYLQIYQGKVKQTDNYIAEALTILNEDRIAYLVLATADPNKPEQTLAYGYAGFRKNFQKNCLELCHIFNSYFFEKIPEYNVSYFGTNMVKLGIHLNRLVYQEDSRFMLFVPRIKRSAAVFYDKLNFEKKGLFRRKRILTSRSAEKLYNK